MVIYITFITIIFSFITLMFKYNVMKELKFVLDILEVKERYLIENSEDMIKRYEKGDSDPLVNGAEDLILIASVVEDSLRCRNLFSTIRWANAILFTLIGSYIGYVLGAMFTVLFQL